MSRSEYGKGSITEIRLEDFLTYGRCRIVPGPRLNMIIGPNGSGKSSIVAAIAIGLGSQVSTMGRAGSLGHFVKYGRDKAIVEITLKDHNAQGVRVQRTIKKNGDSAWNINGKAANLRQVTNLVDKLQIQLGNLCQFLPQDRVFEFARMNSSALLLETQKAIRGSELVDKQLRLIEMRRIDRSRNEEMEKRKKIMEQMIKRQDNLRIHVDQHHERIRQCAKLDLLKKKLEWVEYQIRLEEQSSREQQIQQLCLQHDHYQKLAEPMKHEYERLRQLQDQRRTMLDAMEQADEQERQKMGQSKRRLKDCGLELTSLQIRTGRLEELEKERQKNIEALRMELEVLEGRIGSPPEMQQLEEIQKELETKQVSRDEMERKLAKIESEKRQIEAQAEVVNKRVNEHVRKLEQVEGDRQKRLEMVRQVSPDTVTAYEWMQENRQMFRGKAYGPICIEIQLKDREYASIVEFAIPKNIMTSFVFEDPTDYEMFLNQMCDHKKLGIDVMLYKGGSADHLPRLCGQELQDYGFDGHLSDMILCPETVLKVLCDQLKIHLQPVTIRNNVMFSKVDADLRVSKYCVGTMGYEVQRNQQEVMAVISRPIRESRVLGNRSSPASKKEIMDIIAINRSILQKNCDRSKELLGLERKLRGEAMASEQAYREIADRKDQITKLMNEHRDLERLRHLKQMELESHVNGKSTKELEIELNSQMEQIREIIRKTLSTVQTLLPGLGERMRAMIKVHLTLLDIRVQMEGIRENIETIEQNMNEVQKQLVAAKQLYERQEREIQNQFEWFQTWPLEAVKREFADFPEQVEKLRDMIIIESECLESRFDYSPQILDEYQKLCNEIEEQKGAVQTAEEEASQRELEMSTQEREWAEQVEELVTHINRRFSALFASIQCAGEVRLGRKGRDYEKWGIEIMVKFRNNEELHSLDGERFSGGEKSVTTILYLLALQGLSCSPFRLVDEINQGMDPNNERLVHNLVVKTATESTVQCFLITPKLLDNLEYSGRVKVLCVYSAKSAPERIGQGP